MESLSKSKSNKEFKKDDFEYINNTYESTVLTKHELSSSQDTERNLTLNEQSIIQHFMNYENNFGQYYYCKSINSGAFLMTIPGAFLKMRAPNSYSISVVKRIESIEKIFDSGVNTLREATNRLLTNILGYVPVYGDVIKGLEMLECASDLVHDFNAVSLGEALTL